MNKKNDTATLPPLLIRQSMLNSKSSLRKDETFSADLLKELREKRIEEIRKERKQENTSGPRLAPDTEIKKVGATLKEKAKAYAESLRSVNLSPLALDISSSQKKKDRRLSQSEFNLSSYTFNEPSNVVNLAFEQYMGLDDSLHSGEIENPEALQTIMPVRKRDEKVESKLGSILNYSLPKAKSTMHDLPPLPLSLITSEDVELMQKKHQKLLTQIKVPQHLRHSAIVPIRQKETLISGLLDLWDLTLFNVIDTINTTEVAIPSRNFWIDFEILLKRQFQLENEAVSSFGRIENDNLNLIAVCRFDKAQVASLIWNVFLYLTQLKERIISLENSKSICDIMRSNYDDNNGKCIFELKKCVTGFERSRYLEFKSITGHIRRIALVSGETKVGMQQLVKRISSFICPLIFESRFEYDQSDHILNPPLAISRPLEEGQSKAIEIHILDPSQSSSASLVDENPAIWMETNDDLIANWKKFNHDFVERILLQSEVPLNWHSSAVDLLVRYFDQIFKI